VSRSNGLRALGDKVLVELSDLIGCPAEGITGAKKQDDCWVMTVEVLEVDRVPSTVDILATYDVTVDPDGNVVGYERRRRYLRGQVDE
jgi:Gas vesicle synthesis protein GvpO